LRKRRSATTPSFLSPANTATSVPSLLTTHAAWFERGGAQSGWKCASARLPCWCLRRGRACRAWARRSGAAPRLGAQGSKGTTWHTPSGRAQPRADSKSARAHAPCDDHDHLSVSVRPRKPTARAHGACRPPHPVLVVMLMTKF
jgi:hypothetical protein